MPRPALQTEQGGGTNLRRRYVSCVYFSTGAIKLQIILPNGGKKMTFEEVALMLWARQNHLEIVSVRFVPKEEGKQEAQKK